jgi:uncharacterized protein YndB with AHSA1/START domain
MTTGIEIEPVRKTIAVQAPVENAFPVFTDGIATWWPLHVHSVGADRGTGAPDSAVFEGRVGGRVFERWSDGTEIDWGEVLVWEPPRRIVYRWHPATRTPRSRPRSRFASVPTAAGRESKSSTAAGSARRARGAHAGQLRLRLGHRSRAVHGSVGGVTAEGGRLAPAGRRSQRGEHQRLAALATS